MYVYFVLDEGADISDYTFTLTYSVNNNTKIKEVTPVYDEENTRYYVAITDIPAAYLDYNYKITVTKTETNETYEVTTSVLAYLTLLLSKSEDTNQCNLAKAMYLYSQAASEFFGK